MINLKCKSTLKNFVTVLNGHSHNISDPITSGLLYAWVDSFGFLNVDKTTKIKNFISRNPELAILIARAYRGKETHKFSLVLNEDQVKCQWITCTFKAAEKKPVSGKYHFDLVNNILSLS